MTKSVVGNELVLKFQLGGTQMTDQELSEYSAKVYRFNELYQHLLKISFSMPPECAALAMTMPGMVNGLIGDLLATRQQLADSERRVVELEAELAGHRLDQANASEMLAGS